MASHNICFLKQPYEPFLPVLLLLPAFLHREKKHSILEISSIGRMERREGHSMHLHTHTPLLALVWVASASSEDGALLGHGETHLRSPLSRLASSPAGRNSI